MKFSEMKYTRPDIDALRAALAGVEERIRTARSAGEQIEAFYEEEKLLSAYATQRELASIRNTIDTRDPFYEAERAFFDERSPEVEEADHKVTFALLASPFRAELEERLGSLLFRNAEIAVRAFSPEIMPLRRALRRFFLIKQLHDRYLVGRALLGAGIQQLGIGSALHAAL
ncbi:MAG: hypothetical protein II771_02965, partial [Clostridia bacterium]|nr:hypothetical protein [Clostridia bacterium]